MHLRRLSLSGFKSFADRTRLDFESAVNVVVGPNGAGKSNLVDAVSWVMGTQATSTLRTQRMEDVIFSGTAMRPAHNRAEVSLTFDNTEGMLPLDLAEVTVTRRLFRDGTSEYEINGATCRLLDIQELLNDTHVGRHQHVIVAQGRVAEILAAKPEEHRAVIEEAAGVVKHRSRRDRSIRRLEQTGEDVKRLQDILREQNRLMRPLRRQAEAAERHEQVKAEAAAVRLYLGGEELRSLQSRIAEAEVGRAGHSSALDSATIELDQISSSLARLESAAGESGTALERDTAAAARLETTTERFRRVATVARERRLALESAQRGISERRRDLELEAQHLRNDVAEARQQERASTAAAERADAALRALEDEEKALADQGRLPAEGVVAAARGDAQALEAAAERDRREAEAVEQRTGVMTARLEDEAKELARLADEIRQADGAVAAALDRFEETKAESASAQSRLLQSEEAAQQAAFDGARARARIESIEAAQSGLGHPHAKDQAAASPEVLAAIDDYLAVPTELRAAVAAALGPWADGLVASDVEAVVASMKAAGNGGIAVLADASGDTAPARQVALSAGVDALIDRLSPGGNDGLARRLLGDVVLVEGWSGGWALVRRHPEIRAVTPEGDLIAAAGVRPAHPTGISNEGLEEAGSDLEAAELAEARARSLQGQARREREGAEAAALAAKESLEVLEARLAGATEALALIRRAKTEGEAELARLADRQRSLAEAEVARRERLAELRRRLEAFGTEDTGAWDALTQRRREVGRRRGAASQARQAAAAAAAAAKERRLITEKRLADVESQLGEWDDAGPEAEELDGLSRIEDLARRAQAAASAHVTTLRGRQQRLRHSVGDATDRVARTYQRRQSLEETASSAREAIGALDVELAEQRTRLEAAAEALRRDADASEEEACAAPRPGLAEDTDLADHLEALENDLRRMGPINPLAASEYRELAEHAQFLEAQLADLEESRRDLRKVIAALDEQIAAEFRQAFDEVATYFEENFERLFPGGKGRLRLTNADDPLGTGIEVVAQPLGKRVSRLSLLSGGESSLAAIAFLFAVFRARPSPFYILDEVEAALDDANLRRFLRLVDLLGESSQLVIVTHQQQTMEAADMLYGVTMEPGESSKVIAKRLAEAFV